MNPQKNNGLDLPFKKWRNIWLCVETLLVLFTLGTVSNYLIISKFQNLAIVTLFLTGCWYQRIFLVGHEASHWKLWPSSRIINDILGQAFLLVILVPVKAFRKIHVFHHRYNRKDVQTSALDTFVIESGSGRWSRIKAYGAWYFLVFCGGFFIHSLISILILLMVPPSVARKVSPAFKGWTMTDQLQAMALFGLAIAIQWSVAHFAGFTCWLSFFGLPLVFFAWVYSVLTYIFHYNTSFGPLTYMNVRSLKANFVVRWWLLNFNEHAVHHKFPQIPWFNLAAHAQSNPEEEIYRKKKSLVQGILALLSGPNIVERKP